MRDDRHREDALGRGHRTRSHGARPAGGVREDDAGDRCREGDVCPGSAQTKAQVIRDFIEPELLILDEAGMQRGTDEEKSILFEIIDGRYELSRPSILMTNLALPALEEMIGERVLYRLREGNGRQVVFEWESHRKQRVAEKAL
nr:ATP-binding protein [Pseudoduganella dura]